MIAASAAIQRPELEQMRGFKALISRSVIAR